MELRCHDAIQMTATGLDMRCNKASGCRGGQRGFGEEAMRLLMEQKKKRQRDLGGVEGMNLLPCGGAHIQQATSRGGGAVGW